MTDDERLFPAVFPTGIFYADRAREEHGDYKRLGDVSFSRLELTIDPKCPQGLRRLIEADAERLQAMRGQPYQASTAGQTITLGYALADVRASRDAAARAARVPARRMEQTTTDLGDAGR